jgi:hypothetical protein
MELDATKPAQSVRFLEARLAAVSGRLRASRARPLDRDAIEELTALKFSETRLLRRLRLSDHLRCPQHDVHLLDPGRHLVTELNDASAEAVRRGVLISLGLRGLDQLSRKISFIDALACLLEDGVDAGANYLSLETRLSAGGVVLRLATDSALVASTFALDCLRETHAVELARTPSGMVHISVAARVVAASARHGAGARGATPWTAPRPSSI